MTIKINQAGKWLVPMALLLFVYAGSLSAEQGDSLFNFKFNHLPNIQSVQRADQVPLALSSVNNTTLNFAQYDATWTYPWYPWKTKNINIDLGVTLRHLSGFKKTTENVGNNYFQRVLPLLHASAFYSLPLSGLSAGIEGSHLDSNGLQVFDYRAKVSYEWREGFGLQGGWQHQQFNLDGAIGGGTGYRSTGPFLDFYLNF